MKDEELYKLYYLAHLLEEVTPLIRRYVKEEVPLILENERAFDHHRQMCLPLTYLEEDSTDYDLAEEVS